MGNLRAHQVQNIDVDTVDKPTRIKLPVGTYLAPVAECKEAVVYAAKPAKYRSSAPFYREVDTRFAQQSGRYVVKPKAIDGRVLIAKSASHEDRHIYIVKRPVRPRQIDLAAYYPSQPLNAPDDDEPFALDITRIAQRRTVTAKTTPRADPDLSLKRTNSLR